MSEIHSKRKFNFASKMPKLQDGIPTKENNRGN